MYKLVIEDDEGKTKVVPFIRDEMTIGRKEGNTIRLTERNVSRRHAKLVKNNGAIEIEDYSRYGTKRNGERVSTRAPFREGDVILIGDYRLSLKLAQNVATPEVKRDLSVIPPDKAAKLVVVSSNFAGREFPLVKAEMVIGRTEGDIRIDHRSISRNHAKLIRDGDRYKILDLKSANGVKVNNEPYRSVQLRRGDLIELGHVRMKFVLPGDPPVVIPNDAGASDVNPAAGGGMGKILVAGGVFALLAVVAVVFVLFILPGMSGDGGDQGNTSGDPGTSAVAANGNAGGDGASDGTDEPSDTVDPEVVSLTEKARGQLKAREWDDAIASIDSALKKAPDASRAELNTMRGKAVKEKGFKENYDAGKKALVDKDYETAIDKFKTLPADLTIYGKLVEEEKLIEKARDGLKGKLDTYISDARTQLRADNPRVALRHVNRALDIEPENEDALALQRQIRREIAKADKDKPKDEKPPKDDKPKETKKDPPKGGGMTAAEKKEKRDALLKDARAASAQGSQDAAIAKAQEAMRYGGGGAAVRIMAIAYEKKGDAGNAIKYYNQILRGMCGSPNAKFADVIRKKIAGLGGKPDC